MARKAQVERKRGEVPRIRQFNQRAAKAKLRQVRVQRDPFEPYATASGCEKRMALQIDAGSFRGSAQYGDLGSDDELAKPLPPCLTNAERFAATDED